jgi:membrane protein implicated in regulation of membrane protease activity
VARRAAIATPIPGARHEAVGRRAAASRIGTFTRHARHRRPMEPIVAGTSLLTIGVVLLLLEVSMPGFFVGVVATICIVLGVLEFLTNGWALTFPWAPVIGVAVGAPALAVSFVAYRKIAPADEPPTTTAADNLVGREAVVTRAIEPGSAKGKIRLGRQEWSATGASAIPEGTKVRVAKVEGVVLQVERA